MHAAIHIFPEFSNNLIGQLQKDCSVSIRQNNKKRSYVTFGHAERPGSRSLIGVTGSESKMPRFKISQLVPWLSFVVALCTTILFLFLKLSFVTYVTSLVHLPATLAYMYFHQRHGKKRYAYNIWHIYDVAAL